MGKKPAGPLGITTSRFSLGLEPLSADFGGLENTGGAEFEREVVREAIRRGADPGSAFQLLWRWRQAQGHARRSIGRLRAAPPPSGYSFGLTPIALREDLADVAAASDPPIDVDAIRAEYRIYVQESLNQLATLPLHVRRSFGEPKPLGDKATDKQVKAFNDSQAVTNEKYVRMRSLYYVFGYGDPTRFLKTITPVNMLGHDVDYGVHPAFAEGLQPLRDKLIQRDPTLATRLGGLFKSAIGLQPRPVAGESRPSISNHAFGLAVDIDALTNPMIKDAEVKRILSWVVNEPSFDFGQLAVEASEHPTAPTETAYARLQEASRRVQDWLKRHLYDTQTSWPEDTSAAEDLQSREDVSEDVLKFRSLSRKVSRRELEAWAREGILTVPLVLVLAMKDLMFGWGGEYEGSKDMMHFELNYWRIVPRDAGFEQTPKGTPCRPLDELSPASLPPKPSKKRR
jgi:hypothetical protein